MKPRASVIVLAYRGTDNVRECLAALREQQCTEPFEVLVCFNSTDVEDMEALLPSLDWAKTLYSPVNLGFSGGNNFAAEAAAGDFLVLLNDDAVPEPSWLQSLLNAAAELPRAGLIGSRILFPDGSLQEAGGIIWADGTTAPVGRGLPPNWPCFTTRRPAHYCSANGLLIPRDVWDQVAGFDESFYPAYYEDVDLCLRVRHGVGLEIYYEPSAVLRHKEAQSSDSSFRRFLFQRNVQRIREKWDQELQAYPRPRPTSASARRRAAYGFSSLSKSILVIDDRLPDSGLGSGFGRLEELLIDLHDKAYNVTFFPRVSAGRLDAAYATFVNVLDTPVLEHLELDGVAYDAVIISRPHNFQFYADAVRRLQPRAKIIYDAEALFHRRLDMQARLERDPDKAQAYQLQSREMRQLEECIAQASDRVVCISVDEEQSLIAIPGHCPIDLMAPLASSIVMGASDITQRRSVVFVAGWLAGALSPNIPALEWFANHVLPLVRRDIPDVLVRISGKNPPASIRELADARNFELTGYVENLADFYGEARVAIAPITFGAGVKIKTIEALQHGVPVVATKVGAEGLHLQDGYGIDITDDPAEFGRRLVALLTNDELWRQRRSEISNVVVNLLERRLRWDQVIERACVIGEPASVGA